MSGAQSKSTGNVAIDCILAMEDGGFTPGEITSNSMFLALVRAQGKKYESRDERPVTEIFLEELRAILDEDEQSSLEKVLLTVESQIEEATENGNGYTEAGMKRVAVLSYAATMVRTAIKQASKKE
ncbi:MAG: hypothetical protein HLUCCA11_23630 [Phormidesmis priestleyi Ana]|uniref:Uncharacterized protein n=1 Tax=Phormidesmis priestleyi Ana TaxID=1666911 RepID=A0A0P8BS47_9CYAN|nr:MAG: hypothetical protein HLUCCA11_23630 [Phormidesmis priestleyi Ana]